MKIIERLPEGNPQNDPKMRPRTGAIVLGLVIAVFVAIGFWAPTSIIGGLAFCTAVGLMVCFGLFAGAFALDRRRRRKDLLGR